MCDCDDCCDDCCKDCGECCEKYNSPGRWVIIVTIVLSIVLFISFFLIGYSITYLEPLQWGLKYDENARRIDSTTLYKGGRYATGLGFSFLKFPTQQQILIFSDNLKKEKTNKPGSSFHEDADFYPTLECRTAEGMLITIDLFLGYNMTTSNDDQVRVQQLQDIYSKFGLEWEKFLTLIVLSGVRDSIQQFSAETIPQSRPAIGNSILATLQKSFSEYFFTILVVNVINIDFPVALDQAYTNTQIVFEQKSTMNFTLFTAMVNANTSLLVAQKQALMIQQQSVAQGQSNFISKQVQADATSKSIVIQLQALKNIKTQLGFTNSGTDLTNTAAKKILTFLWIYFLNQNEASRTVLSTNFPNQIA